MPQPSPNTDPAVFPLLFDRIVIINRRSDACRAAFLFQILTSRYGYLIDNKNVCFDISYDF